MPPHRDAKLLQIPRINVVMSVGVAVTPTMVKGLQCYLNIYLLDKIRTLDLIWWGSVLARKSIPSPAERPQMSQHDSNSNATGCRNNKTVQYVKRVLLM